MTPFHKDHKIFFLSHVRYAKPSEFFKPLLGERTLKSLLACNKHNFFFT